MNFRNPDSGLSPPPKAAADRRGGGALIDGIGVQNRSRFLKKPRILKNHFLVGMGEGAMLESGTFSCGDGGRGHVGIWDIFLWDPRPLGWLFGAFRLLEIRNAFVSGFICSEKD